MPEPPVSRELFHPALRRHARVLPRRPFLGPRSLRLMQLSVQRLPDRTHTEVERITSTASVRIHRPAEGSGRHGALLWVHGGGFVMGSARQDDRRCARLAQAANLVVAAVDYRLAPQHPYPAGLHDCYDALTWLAAHPDIDPSRIAVGGASAGGGLAAALTLLARDRGGPQLAFQLLVYPMLDDRTTAHADPQPKIRRLWDAKANHLAWQAYLGHPPGQDDVSPLTAPARATALTGLPPAWIGIASLDLLHDEALDYARRLKHADVPCTLEEVNGAFHGFDIFRTTNVARGFESSQVSALQQALSAEA